MEPDGLVCVPPARTDPVRRHQVRYKFAGDRVVDTGIRMVVVALFSTVFRAFRGFPLMDSLVRIDSVSKIYPRVHKPRERLKAFIALLFGREPGQGAEVLRDINLDVVRGQSLGIIGENGAGKSTLLKVLT
ncbi:MAG: ATP-binding cassette domain-containing protein, partial [Desulfobulbaceae bacterium]